MGTEDRSNLLSMSLVELAFILFFILLLIALVRDMGRGGEIDRCEEKRKDCEYALGVSSGAETGLRDLTKRLRYCGERLAECDKASEDVRQRIRELTERLVKCEGDFEEQVVKAQQAASGRDQCTNDLSDTQAQCDWLTDNCGIGPPPCWVDEAGERPEWLYRIWIHEDDLRVEPAWPSRRQSDAEALPRTQEVLGENVSLEQFAAYAAPLKRWSESQRPECRHYVILYDRAESKSGYKNKRLMIENFFYKLESPK